MKQTLITLIENKPGVLHRIASLFRRRNFNIESVVAGSSETPGITRMTIVTNEMDRQKRVVSSSAVIRRISNPPVLQSATAHTISPMLLR